MDPVTAFVIATLMMLLNGGMLGVMQRDLAVALRPSAKTWRIGTLLLAGGCLLLAVQRWLAPGFVLPVANGLIMTGLTAYWRAIRQFYGEPDHWLVWAPAALGTFGIYWFAAWSPSLPARVEVASVVWIVVLLGSAWGLRSPSHSDAAISRRALSVIFLGVAAFMAVRALYFATGAVSEQTVLDAGSWVNLATPMMAAVLPVTGTTAFLLMCSERLRRQWEHAASTDALTGLANRRTLTEEGARRLEDARAQGRGFAVAVVDVDHFKQINDRHGHDVGDLALRHLAARLSSACRGMDLPARQGGEEFVVLFGPIEAGAAVSAAERLRLAVEGATFTAGALELSITVSIGVAALGAADSKFDDLIRRADQALYAAKAGGRNRVVLAP